MSRSLVVAFALAALFVASPASAEDHAIRVAASVAPYAVGAFSAGEDGHYDPSGPALGARVGARWAPIRQFQVGIDATMFAPYGGVVVHYSTQLALRGAIPVSDATEIGLSARFGPGWARVQEGAAYDTTTRPYGPGPALTYHGWEAGLGFDVTHWVTERMALVFALEAIVGNKTTTPPSNVDLGYVRDSIGPGILAPWVGLQFVL